MPKQTKNCRVCGKVYEACRSIKTGDTVFNWREVACSPECGRIYLQRITASRSGVSPDRNSGKTDEAAAQHVSRKKKAASVPVSDINTDSAHKPVSPDAESTEE